MESDKIGSSIEQGLRVCKNNELTLNKEGKDYAAITERGNRYRLEWKRDTEFLKLDKVKQVYGYLFDDEGRLLIVNPNSSWRLPGGGVEEKDDSYEDTLIRESMEEADAEIENLVPMGYIKVIPLEKNSQEEVHYLLRYVGKVVKLNEQTIDEAIGEIGERKFIDPKNFLDYIDWGNLGMDILDYAMEVRDGR